VLKHYDYTPSVLDLSVHKVFETNIYLGGNISSTNDQYVTITYNTVNGNVEITGPNNYCTESSNNVNGNNSGCP